MPDLSIKYNNEVIGELNNSGTATLKTADKKCVSDIEVEYTKPSGSAIGNTVNLSDGIVDEAISIKGAFFEPTGVYRETLSAEPNIPGSALALCEEGRDSYLVFLTFESEEDLYSMTVNGTPVTFDRGAYRFISSPSADPINGQTYNVVIAHKV